MIVCLHSTRYNRLRLEMPDLYERVYTLCDKHCVILVWERDYFDTLHRGNSEMSLLSARRRIIFTYFYFYLFLFIFILPPPHT